jgi:hypothetical protein
MRTKRIKIPVVPPRRPTPEKQSRREQADAQYRNEEEKRRETGDVMANEHRDPMVRFWMTRVTKQISRSIGGSRRRRWRRSSVITNLKNSSGQVKQTAAGS